MRFLTLLAFLVALPSCIIENGLEPNPDPPPDTKVDTAEPVEPPPDDSEPPEPVFPVAVCKVTPNPVTPPFETATWDGSNSYDPEGRTLTTFDWSLTSIPQGSAAIMPVGHDVRSNFEPDLAGDYVAQLVVKTGDGTESEPCTVTLESIPAEDLWIEMFWTHSGDDMDLHLLDEGGSLTSNRDCYYANCVSGGLNWGSSADYDDPSLDLDDIPGTGPENINIAAPEDKEYTIYVHDYPGSSYSSTNPVTVNVYLNGEMVWSDTRPISGENDYVPFAVVDWSAGVVTAL